MCYNVQLRDTIFYMKTNVLQDFHICISVPLNRLTFIGKTFKNQISVTNATKIISFFRLRIIFSLDIVRFAFKNKKNTKPNLSWKPALYCNRDGVKISWHTKKVNDLVRFVIYMAVSFTQCLLSVNQLFLFFKKIVTNLKNQPSLKMMKCRFFTVHQIQTFQPENIFKFWTQAKKKTPSTWVSSFW